MSINIGNKKSKLYIGNTKVSKAYLGSTKIYSSGNIVTYHVDTGITYQEEIDEGESCLSHKTFTPSKGGWDFIGWREDSTASGSVLSVKIMDDDPVTLYAVFRQTVTVTYYNNSTSDSKTSGYRYYNNGAVTNPSFTLSQASRSGWTARGWSTSNAGNGGITYNNGASFTRDSNITLYGLYQQPITLSYNGNGSTGGSTAEQTGTRYWAPAGYINPSFSLRANGFSRTNYNFSKWAMGSAGGTQYSAGASVTLSANTTFFAVWTAAIRYIIQNGQGSMVELHKDERMSYNFGYSSANRICGWYDVDFDEESAVWTTCRSPIFDLSGISKIVCTVYNTCDTTAGVTFYPSSTEDFGSGSAIGFVNGYVNGENERTFTINAPFPSNSCYVGLFLDNGHQFNGAFGIRELRLEP